MPYNPAMIYIKFVAIRTQRMQMKFELCCFYLIWEYVNIIGIFRERIFVNLLY